ncbi:MAG: CvpA family protein [Litorilinea sp.]
MGPVELIFFTVGIIVTLIGLARGYVRELGSTLIILVAIFILSFFQTELAGFLNSVTERVGGTDGEAGSNLLLSIVFTIIFSTIVFMSYSGRTLTFPGSPAPPPQGTLLSLAIGLLNGYLVAGTLWYYQDVYEYPISQFVEFTTPLTERAQTLVGYLPPALFDNPVYWVVPVAVLLLVKVRG